MAYARGIWGDDAMYCEFDRSWHHREYHLLNGYETQALTGEEGEAVQAHPVAPDCYLEGPALLFVHRCDWEKFGGAVLRKTVLSQERWCVSQTEDGQLTVHPSIACRACGIHGFFAAGEWRAC